MTYFEHLHGYNEFVAFEFSQNLKADRVRVYGIKIEVTEETVSIVSRLPQNKIRWFARKTCMTSQTEFLEKGEEVRMRV